MSTPRSTYDNAFFALHDEGARLSARRTIPVLFEFVRPAGVVDVGCGQGTWLAEFKAAGVTDYLGVDGDYVDRAKLRIEPERFLARDLTEPLVLDRRFDLAVCLEVAEHLPPECAGPLVASLVRLAPVVLFSAAIPHQQGDGHVNLQWPDVWSDIFKRHGFIVADCLRRRLWRDSEVESWYRQNMLLFVERARLGDYPRLRDELERSGADPPLSVVHPELYQQHIETLIAQVREARQIAMRAVFRLRDCTLLWFPDWTQPPDALQAQLQALLRALANHADHERTTLLIHCKAPVGEPVLQFVKTANAGLPSEIATRLEKGPAICTINDTLPPQNWLALLDCVQWRVALDAQDGAAVAAAQAGALSTITLAQIEGGQSLAKT